METWMTEDAQFDFVLAIVEKISFNDSTDLFFFSENAYNVHNFNTRQARQQIRENKHLKTNQVD